MALPRIVRGIAAAFLFTLPIAAFCAISNGSTNANPNATTIGNAEAGLSQAQLQEIDDYLADYFRGVLITKRTLNERAEVITCVDVMHQPASRHSPQIQLEPSDELKALLGGQVTRAPDSTICPRGSVEMRVPTRNQIISRGGLQKFLKKDCGDDSRPMGPPPAPEAPAPSTTDSGSSSFLVDGHYWASVNMDVNATGAQSTFTMWQPKVPKVPDPTAYYLFSLSQLWINGGGTSGGTGDRQSIEAGTHVYQALYVDVESHFFIYWTADNYKDLKCQDLRCPAFVVTSSILPIGGSLPYAAAGSPSIEGTIAWYRDPATGNWILFLYDAVNGYRQVGYYPVSLFNGGQLSRYATRISFGGEVFTPKGDLPTLPMGSGINPMFYSGPLVNYVAYQRGLKYMNSAGSLRDLYASYIWTTPYKDGCAYGARFYPASNAYIAGWGSTLFYGGKGFSASCKVTS